MNIEKTLKEAEQIMRRWKPGTRVWHRANGRRGLIDGFLICADGAIMVRVSWGDNQTPNYPFELSATRVSDDDDDWRNDEAAITA